MRFRAISGAMLIAAAATTGAFAATAAKDPRTLALEPAGFPAGSRVSVERSPASAMRAIGRGLKHAVKQKRRVGAR